VRTQIKGDGLHIWPFDPTFPIDVRSLTFAADRDRPLTRHDYFELLYVYSGKALYQFEGREVLAEEHDLIRFCCRMRNFPTSFRAGPASRRRSSVSSKKFKTNCPPSPSAAGLRLEPI